MPLWVGFCDLKKLHKNELRDIGTGILQNFPSARKEKKVATSKVQRSSPRVWGWTNGRGAKSREFQESGRG